MKAIHNVKKIFLVAAVVALAYACNNDDDFVPRTATYQLTEVMSSGVFGQAKFTEREDGSTLIEISIDGAPATVHPAHIHVGSVDMPGAIAITLQGVDAETGRSSTTVTQTDAGEAITYDELLEYNGYINVHYSPVDLTVMSQGNIGSNTQ